MPVTVCEFESRPGHSKSGLQISATHFSFMPRPHGVRNFKKPQIFSKIVVPYLY